MFILIVYTIFGILRFVVEIKQLKFSDPDKSKMVGEILNRFDIDDCLEYVRYDTNVCLYK